MLNREEKKELLKTDAQVALFINKAILTTDPNVFELYDPEDLSLQTVLDIVKPYTRLFDDKSLLWFQNWRLKQSLAINNLGRRNLVYVLDPKYLDEVAQESATTPEPNPPPLHNTRLQPRRW
ncbi:hypothetical protein PS15m_011134 [Mucor circinelloides]